MPEGPAGLSRVASTRPAVAGVLVQTSSHCNHREESQSLPQLLNKVLVLLHLTAKAFIIAFNLVHPRPSIGLEAAAHQTHVLQVSVISSWCSTHPSPPPSAATLVLPIPVRRATCRGKSFSAAHKFVPPPQPLPHLGSSNISSYSLAKKRK